jgi:hypothetical protein
MLVPGFAVTCCRGVIQPVMRNNRLYYVMPTSSVATVWIAWWGAGLSTILATVKLYELWRDRFRIDISYNFAGIADIGNKILIRNLGGKAFILGHWELMYGRGRRPFRKYQGFANPEYDCEDVTIAAYSTHVLTFRDHEHFGWGVDDLAGRSIFIRLHVAGRSPKIRLVYRP